VRRLYPLLAGTESARGYSPNHAHHPKWACKHLLAVSIMPAMRHSGVKERRISRAGDSLTNAGKPRQRRMRLLRSVMADGCDRRCGAGFGQDAELCERCADNLGRFAQVREASRRVFSPESRSGDPFACAGEKLARRVALAMAAAAPAPDPQDYADEEQYLAALADWNHGDEKVRRRYDRQRTTDK
jgi:hypothetical protein